MAVRSRIYVRFLASREFSNAHLVRENDPLRRSIGEAGLVVFRCSDGAW